MPHIIPQTPPEPGPGRKAELALWRAFETGLGEDWFVYPNLKYIDDGEQCREGEADFVLLHREHGMLVVEVKGYGVKRNGQGQWMRLDPGGEWRPLKQSPFAQAERTKWQLVEILQHRMKRAFPDIDGFPLVHGHACCFPLTSVGDLNLPLEVPRTLLFDVDDLERIEERVLQALGVFAAKAGRAASGLDKKSFKRFRKQVVHPTLELVPTMSAAIRAESAALVQLTGEQRYIMDGLSLNRRIGVLGGAGTGKTLMALEAARRFAAAGESVLLLCFNRQLAGHLKDLTAPGDGDEASAIKATNFHSLCVGAHWKVHDRGPDIPSDRSAAEAWWRDESPCLLYEGLEAKVMDRFDAIVIDEGQDFAEPWWTVIDDLLNDSAAGRLVVFYDPHQTIFGRACHVPELPTRFQLRRNMRNTRRIGALVGELAGIDLEMHPRAPEGRDPVVHAQGSPARTVRELDELISRLTETEGLLPDQIAILTPHTRGRSTLAEVGALGGCELATDPRDRDGKLLHATIGAFKGLESDVVILLDIDPNDPRADRNARYVAVSRARHLLHVFQRGGAK